MAAAKGGKDRDELSLVWDRLFALFLQRRDAMFEVLRTYELTPPHGLALVALLASPLRMRDLAEHMRCDASYITALVDRLEQLGLAQRQPSSTDRRVKEIALTAEGTRAAKGIRSTMLMPPPEFDRLSSRERTTLVHLLAKVAPEDAGASTIFRLPVGFGFKPR